MVWHSPDSGPPPSSSAFTLSLFLFLRDYFILFSKRSPWRWAILTQLSHLHRSSSLQLNFYFYCQTILTSGDSGHISTPTINPRLSFMPAIRTFGALKHGMIHSPLFTNIPWKPSIPLQRDLFSFDFWLAWVCFAHYVAESDLTSRVIRGGKHPQIQSDLYCQAFPMHPHCKNLILPCTFPPKIEKFVIIGYLDTLLNNPH